MLIILPATFAEHTDTDRNPAGPPPPEMTIQTRGLLTLLGKVNARASGYLLVIWLSSLLNNV